MNHFFSHIIEALKKMTRDTVSIVLFFFAWAAFFVLMFAIPLKVIPGNDLRFQAMLYGMQDYGLLGVLSFLSALVITMQVYIFRLDLAKKAGGAVMSAAGIFSGLISSIFASATCAMCVGAMFGFLGFGTVFFLVSNRWLILLGSTVLLTFSLYLSSRRMMRGCEVCLVTAEGRH